MHVYSVKESTYRNKPVIEILVDGNTWGNVYEYDENFRFGLTKAKMIIAGMDTIEKFYNSDGRELPLENAIKIENEKYGIILFCTKFDEFKVYDKILEKPYLELVAEGVRLGIGLQKARALLDLEDEIKQFIDKNINRDRS